MATISPSIQCLRVLRRSLYTESSVGFSRPMFKAPVYCPFLPPPKANLRPFGQANLHLCRTLAAPTRRRCQRRFSIAAARRQGPSDSRQPLPPFTTGTVTSNVTAAPPPSTPAAAPAEFTPAPTPQSTSGPSTAEMQREISKRLSQPRSLDLTHNLAAQLRKRAPAVGDTYIKYGLTQTLFKTCSAQASYTIPEEQRLSVLTGKRPPKTAGGEDLGIPDAATGNSASSTFWFSTLALPPTFSTWSQVSFLHMYLLIVRLRAVDSPAAFQNYHRYLLEHFSQAAEDKMGLLHGMAARSIRNRYLKDLFLQWRGVLAAYDEGLIAGDAVLAGAVWRNLFKGRDDVDWVAVGVVVAYMRRAAAMLARVEVRELADAIEGPDGVFETARKGLLQDVARESRGVAEPFKTEDQAQA